MADKIRFNCTCGKSLSAELELAGQRTHCSRCGETVYVPVPQMAGVADGLFSEHGTTQPIVGGGSPWAGGAPISAPDVSNAKLKRPAADSMWNDQDDFLSQQNLAGDCPQCGARMSGHAVVCLDCGYNKQSGKLSQAPVSASSLVSSSAAEPAREKAVASSGAGAKLLLFGIVAILLVLGVGSFYSKAIGFTAVCLGFVSIILGMGSFFLSGLTELFQNSGARRSLLNSVLMTALMGPLGFVVVQRTRNNASANSRLYNLGKLLFMIGVPLLFLGVFGIAKQVPRRPARPAIKAPASKTGPQKARPHREVLKDATRQAVRDGDPSA